VEGCGSDSLQVGVDGWGLELFLCAAVIKCADPGAKAFVSKGCALCNTATCLWCLHQLLRLASWSACCDYGAGCQVLTSAHMNCLSY
jgi:hypothetical protein